MAFRDIERNLVKSPKPRMESYIADAAVKQGQIVRLSGDDNRVEPSDTDGDTDVVGLAIHDAEADSDVTVATWGTNVIATAATLVDAGDQVTTHGNTGEPGEVTTAEAGDPVIGNAIRDAVGTNDDVLIRLEQVGVMEESA